MSPLLIFITILAGFVAFAAVFFIANRWLKTKNLSVTRRRAAAILLASAAFITVFTAAFSPLFYEYLSERHSEVKDRSRYLMYFVIPCILTATILLTAFNRVRKDKQEFFTTKNMVRMAVFTALSIVLYLFVKFPLPFIFPEFLDIQISDMPALLAGFTMGTGAGSVIIILKTLIKLPFTGTGGVGELADLILGLIYVVSTSTIYRFFKSKSGAACALGIGSVLVTISAIIVNRVLLIPFYTTYLLPWQVLLGMVEPLYPNVTKQTFYNYYLWLAVLPFNALRCLITSLVTFFMYKPTKRIFGKSLR